MAITSATTITAANFHTAVLEGIAAGEVKRVKIGDRTHFEWHRPEGFVTKWGRVFTRRPNVSVIKLIAAGFARVRPDGVVVTTASGRRELAR